MKPARDGYSRIVLFQPATGYVVDVGGHHALAAATPSVEESYFSHAAGSDRARLRSRTFELPVIMDDLIQHLRVMRHLGCPVQMVAIGWKRHEVWLVDTDLALVEQRRGAPGFAGEMVRLTNRLFHAAIYQASNLLEGIPWTATDATFISDTALSGSGSGGDVPSPGSGSGEAGSYYLLTDDLAGYAGPLWESDPDAAVDAAGALVVHPTEGGGGSGSAGAVVEFSFPLGGVRLILEALTASGTAAGTLYALDADGVVLDSAESGDAFVLPHDTWGLRIAVEPGIASAPVLSVLHPGAALPPRVGVRNPCSTPTPPSVAVLAVVPAWAENEAPVLDLWDVSAVAAPFLEDLTDFEGVYSA